MLEESLENMWKWHRALVTGVVSENCLVKTIEGNEQNGVYHSAGRFYKTVPLGTGTLTITHKKLGRFQQC